MLPEFRHDVNSVILRDARTSRWLLFDRPRDIVVTHRPGDVRECLKTVDDAVSRRGLYAAGMIAYEAAPAFDPDLVVHGDGVFPLLWFGLYDPPKEVDICSFRAGSLPRRPCWSHSVSRAEYSAALGRIRHHLLHGDTYQVNYTFRLRSQVQADPWTFFIHLVAAQGMTYGAYLNMGGWAVCSASPELFFTLDGACLESRPMKGTAARGLDRREDLRQASGLQASEKDRAENLMIVDMLRNDMGRIAEPGSVDVPRLFTLERYPTVWQMTSTVRARTRAAYADIFSALFPAASITGAPKRRTMQIIANLETTPRRVYTGTVGYMAPGRRSQFNVAIRSLLLNTASREAEYGVGGGIVWDSDCEREWAECGVKAQVLHGAAEPFSLLETILWTPDCGFHLLDRHLDRLGHSASQFDYPFRPEAIRGHLALLSERFPSFPHRIRLLLSADGGIDSGSEPLDTRDPAGAKPVALARFPVDKANLFLRHKTTNRRIYEEALAACPGYDDVILYNEDGDVTESTRANVLVDLGGSLCTPPVRCGLLAGTFRAWMIEEKMIEERNISVDELLRTDRVFLINSVRGMYRVSVESPT